MMSGMARAEALERRLRDVLQTRADVLALYRRWLDDEGINAETDGWPSEEAHDEANVSRFIEDVRGND